MESKPSNKKLQPKITIILKYDQELQCEMHRNELSVFCFVFYIFVLVSHSFFLHVSSFVLISFSELSHHGECPNVCVGIVCVAVLLV